MYADFNPTGNIGSILPIFPVPYQYKYFLKGSAENLNILVIFNGVSKRVWGIRRL
jgi:hypothetical protein